MINIKKAYENGSMENFPKKLTLLRDNSHSHVKKTRRIILHSNPKARVLLIRVSLSFISTFAKLQFSSV